MAAATLRSLDQVRNALIAALGKNPLSLGPINTRVLLRTGANMKDPRPDQNIDQAVVAKVVKTLAEMGYSL